MLFAGESGKKEQERNRPDGSIVKDENYIETWRAELLEPEVRVFVIFYYLGDDTHYPANAMYNFYQKNTPDTRNIKVTCGSGQTISCIENLEEYLKRYKNISVNEVNHLYFVGHGCGLIEKEVNGSPAYSAYGLNIPIIGRDVGVIGDVASECNKSIREFVGCFSNLLAKNAVVEVIHCFSGKDFMVDVPLKNVDGTNTMTKASVIKRIKNYLPRDINVIGLLSEGLYSIKNFDKWFLGGSAGLISPREGYVCEG